MKVYQLSKPLLVSMFVLLGFLSLIVIFFLFNAFVRLGTVGVLKWFFLAWFALLAWIWYVYLRVPFEIKMLDDNSLEFRGILGRTTVSPQDIKSIKAEPLSVGFLNLKYTKGNIRLHNRMTGLYELIATVKSLNPDVEIKGC